MRETKFTIMKTILLTSILATLSCINIFAQADPVSITYFEKRGPSYEETFSIRNNLSVDITSLVIRFVYILKNGDEIDYRDIRVSETIPAKRTKQLTYKSFDQNMDFAYIKGKTAGKDYYTLFDIEYEILDYGTQNNNSASSRTRTESRPQGRNDSAQASPLTGNYSARNNTPTTQSYNNAYIGHTTGEVNMRPSPSTNSSIIKKLIAGSQIFIISSTPQNGFYNIIDIETNKEGFVHKNYVTLSQKVDASEGGLFTPVKTISQTNPSVEVFNRTSKILTLKLNEVSYVFKPMEKRIISLRSINYNYIASAPGVIPAVGTESLQSNMSYSWEFFIVTSRRR